MFTKGKPEGKGGGGVSGGDTGHTEFRCALKCCGNKTADPSKVTFWSSFSSFVVGLCAAYTNILVVLCSLSRKSHADLVEPLVTAAVTLDPVHLKYRTFGFLDVLLCHSH